MLFDLGVSSPQLDDASRGFSYRTDAPLDMRMDQTDTLTARAVVNEWPQEELRRILSQYGEERYAPTIAAAIVRRRQERPIETTLELVEVIRGAKTSDETYSTIAALASELGKEPVEVNEAPGFVVNKILIPMINEAIGLVETGVASVADIDKAMQLGANLSLIHI